MRGTGILLLAAVAVLAAGLAPLWVGCWLIGGRR